MTHTDEQQLPVLTAKDLKGFDRRRVALIREMEGHGWRGRRGSKHHVVMRAPDGTTTTAISPKVISPKNEHHVAADFRRWLRQQEQAAAPAPAEVELLPLAWPAADATSVLVALSTPRPVPDLPEIIQEGVSFAGITVDAPEPEPVDTAVEPVVAVLRNTQQQLCGLCEKPFATLQALSVHRVRVHSKVCCEVCDDPMSPSNLARHLRKHAEDIGTHTEAMREVLRLRDELAQARLETAQWEQIADEIEDRYTAVRTRMENAAALLATGD